MSIVLGNSTAALWKLDVFLLEYVGRKSITYNAVFTFCPLAFPFNYSSIL